MRRLRVDLDLADLWQPLIFAIVGIVLAAGLMLFRLGRLTPGFSQAELDQRASASSVQKILDNPLYLAQKAPQLALQKLDRRGPTAMRLPAALMGVVAIVAMFIILKNWHTTRMATIGALLFATSSWFLHTARLATTEINFLMPMLLILGGVWLNEGKFRLISVVLVVFSAVTLLYVPAMVWLILPAAIWRRRIFMKALRQLSAWLQTILIMLVFLGLVPLVWALVRQPDLILPWLGMPEQFPVSIVGYLRNIAQIPLNIFIRGNGDPAMGIGRIPFLDAFTAVMALLGTYAYVFRLKLDRTKLIMATGILATLLIALGGPVKIGFLMPFIYMLACAGITLLIQQWFTVFPRNPLARTSALVIVTLVTLTATYYHLNHYFIAWPNVPATRTTFSHKP